MNYREIIFELKEFEVYSQIMIAHLAELGFESFEEEPPLLKAYVGENDYQKNFLETLSEYQDQFTLISDKELEKINWNEEWEKNFQPLSIGDFCYVRAPFHQALDTHQYELVIEPKMSFGTGHHATTQNMVLLMSALNFKDSSVLDVGSGTGILAILASKMGATEVIATDIEEWAFENMQENFERNDTPSNRAILGSLPLSELSNKTFDFVLANINKNVLLEQIPMYKDLMHEGSYLLLSGFYREDEKDISDLCSVHSLTKLEEKEKDNWMAVSYQLTMSS